MNTSKLNYSRTIEVAPEQAELLNHLVDKYIVPVLEKRQTVAQDAIPNRLTPEQELSSILNFGIPERTEVPARRPPIKVTQGRFNAKELSDLHKLLSFGQPMKKEQDEQQEESGVE